MLKARKLHAFHAALFVALCALVLSCGAGAVELIPAGVYPVSPVGKQIRGMDVTDDGSVVYVGGLHIRSLIRLEVPSGNVTTVDLTTVHPKADVKSVAIDPEGRIWVPFTTPVLAVYAPDLELLTWFDLAPFGITNTEGAAVAPNGDVYVTNRANDKPGLFKFRWIADDLEPVKEFGLNGWVPINELRIPVFTPDGDVMLTSWTAGQVHLVDAETGMTTLFAEVPRSFMLDVDGAGRVYIVHYEQKNPALTILDPGGSILGTWSAAELGFETELSGVAVTRDGTKLFILDQTAKAGGSVRAFDVKH